MDLCERKKELEVRHPWESARFKALESLIRRIPSSQANLRVLDVGCGDGFIIGELAKKERFETLTGIDIHIPSEQVGTISNSKKIIYCNAYAHLKEEYYTLVLLLDVIEHVKDDKAFVSNIVERYVAPGGYIIIMVPAFQFIFSSHDRFLKHFRRYRPKDLAEITEAANLKIVNNGYFFLSLFPVRILRSAYEKLFPRKEIDRNIGIGAWNHGRVVTKFIEGFLRGDNSFSMVLNQLGLKIPGLSAWTLCKKQP